MTLNALVTGAAGFVGRHMCRTLELAGWNVTGTDVKYGTGGAPNFINRGEVFDLVVHAAAAGPNRQAIDTQAGNFPYNVMLDASIIEWCITTQQRRLVYLSSCAVYSNELRHPTLGGDVTSMRFPFTENMGFLYEPFDVYGETKRIGEKMAMQAKKAGVAVHIVRPFSGYGEDQSTDFPFGAFVERAKKRVDPFPIWGNANQVRDFIHIDDVCQGILAIVDADYQEPVNLCTGVGTSMIDLARTCAAVVKYVPDYKVDENAPMGVFYRVGDPTVFHSIYEPKISLMAGVKRALGNELP